MIVELDPGTPGTPSGEGRLHGPGLATRGRTSTSTRSSSSLDRDTRDYLRLLVAGGGEGLRTTAATFANASGGSSRSTATSRSSPVSSRKRRMNLAHLIHNLQLLVTEVGSKDKQLAELVVSQNAVFQAFANQDANLRETLRLLPGALAHHQHGAAEVRRSSPTSSARRCASCGPARGRSARPSVATQAFARRRRRSIKNQLRPFTKRGAADGRRR